MITLAAENLICQLLANYTLLFLLTTMKDRISIILAGFTPIFCLGLKHILHMNPRYHISHCFSTRDEIENFIINGGSADILIFADSLTDITFIPKAINMKTLVFTSCPDRFKYDNWFYVNITGTIDWDSSDDDFCKIISKLIKGGIEPVEKHA